MRVQVADRLKHGSKGVARPIRQPLRRALIVVVEVALTVIVATGAGLLLKSFNRLLHVDPGFVTARRDGRRHRAAGRPAIAGAPSQRAFVDEAVARIRALPCRHAVAATNLVPQGSGRSGIGVAVEGRPAPAPGDELSAELPRRHAGLLQDARHPARRGTRLHRAGRAASPSRSSAGSRSSRCRRASTSRRPRRPR